VDAITGVRPSGSNVTHSSPENGVSTPMRQSVTGDGTIAMPKTTRIGTRSDVATSRSRPRTRMKNSALKNRESLRVPESHHRRKGHNPQKLLQFLLKRCGGTRTSPTSQWISTHLTTKALKISKTRMRVFIIECLEKKHPRSNYCVFLNHSTR